MDPTSQRILLGSAGEEKYWIATLSDPYVEPGRSVVVDNSGNAYICGYTDTSSSGGYENLVVAKYNASGIIQWQRTLGGSFRNFGESISVDNSGNVYVCGNTFYASTTEAIIVKYDYNGIIQWQRALDQGGAGGINTRSYSISVDTSGNVYVCGSGTDDASGGLLVVKLNASGVIQWQRTLSGPFSDIGYSIAVDSSSNVYVCGSALSSGGVNNQNILIAKYNTSGTIQWQRTLSGPDYAEVGESLAVDSSGNVYICGYTLSAFGIGGSQSALFIAKYNTSGTIQWQRFLVTNSTTPSYGYSIAVDSLSNAYVCGYTNDGLLIAKYNTSGTIQWQRILSGSSNTIGHSISLSNSGSAYVCGYTNMPDGYTGILIAKLPGDGSLTGTYGTFTYASSSLIDSTLSLTDATSSLTDTASSFTSSTSSFTDAASSLTSSTITL